MTSTLKEHPIWHNVTQTLGQINPDQIASYHLQVCQAGINGYWDEDATNFTKQFASHNFPPQN